MTYRKTNIMCMGNLIMNVKRNLRIVVSQPKLIHTSKIIQYSENLTGVPIPLADWEWTKSIEYGYTPPLLEAGILVQNDSNSIGAITVNRPGLFPISDEEFLQPFCGFMDAEGSLSLYITEDRILFQVRICIHTDDHAYLEKLEEKLGLGRISKAGPNMKAWEVGDLGQIVNTLIPIFDKYPFVSAKGISNKYFKEACLYKYNYAYGRQLTKGEREHMISLRDKMNRNISFTDIKKWDEEVRINGRITAYQLLGFVEGDGSFLIMGHSPCLSISQKSGGQSALDIIEKYFNNLPDRGIFKYKFDLTHLEKPYIQKSPYMSKGRQLWNYRVLGIDAIYYYLLPFFWCLEFQTRKGIDFRLWVVAIILVKKRISKNTEGRIFLDKLQNSMNDSRYLSHLKVDRSGFVSLEEVNFMLKLPSNVDLESKFISANEAMLEDRAGLSNKDRAIQTLVYDSHDHFKPIIGSPFPSLKAAAKGLSKVIDSASESGLRSALDTSRLYWGRFKITSKPWSPEYDTRNEFNDQTTTKLTINSRQLITNKPGNEGTITIVVDLANNKEVGIYPSFKAAHADSGLTGSARRSRADPDPRILRGSGSWERPISLTINQFTKIVKENGTHLNYKFFLASHLPQAFYKGEVKWG